MYCIVFWGASSLDITGQAVLQMQGTWQPTLCFHRGLPTRVSLLSCRPLPLQSCLHLSSHNNRRAAFSQSPTLPAGLDGRLAEFDLEGSSVGAGLRTVFLERCTPAGAAPCTISFAPPLPYYAEGSTDTLLVAADSAHKLRLYNSDSRQRVGTFAGPVFCGPLQQSLVFR